MATEVRIFTPTGDPLDDLNVVPIASHIVNDVGDASFTISQEDSKATEQNLKFGNLILIRHDSLPDWVGVISSEQGREYGAGSIKVTALSAEVLLNRRIVFPTPMKGTTGAILRQMLDSIAGYQAGGIKLQPGSIYMGGRQNIYPLLGRCREVMDRIAKKGKCDWSVSPLIENGRLNLYVNLYRGERGNRKERILDARNTKLVDPFYTEDGEIWNHVVFMRPVNEQGEIKISRTWRDEYSVGRYGLAQYLGESNVDEEEALDWLARAWLYDHAYPRGVMMPTIIDHSNTFRDIEMGGVYRWEHHGVPFSDWLIRGGDDVRLTGFEVDYGLEEVNATLESTRKPFDITELFNM